MSNTLEAIRAKLKQMEENRSKSSGNFNADKSLYPHWNIEEDQTATVRFLPDANPDNPFFWVEKQIIRLPFPGVKGHDESKPVVVQVPCIEMWGETCPILSEVRPMFADKSLEELARRYWKKRSYLFQGFVQDSPMVEEDPPENPIRKFTISPQLYNIIKASLMDPDMEDLPTDYVNGLDFKITKTKSGQHAGYTTSKYARKETALTDTQLEAINQFGLADLSTYLPPRPSQEALAAMVEMFHASINGELYDPEQWGKFYRPYGLDIGNRDSKKSESPTSSNTVSTSAPAHDATDDTDEDDAPFVPDTPKASAPASTPTPSTDPAKKSVDDILAMVRNRKNG